jgi:uracil-DNA glycosylase
MFDCIMKIAQSEKGINKRIGAMPKRKVIQKPNQKYLDVEIKVKKNPIIIVGQNPGRQRKDSKSIVGYCWNGNRSADLLLEAIEGQKNLILTNLCQYREMNEDNLFECYVDLQEKCDTLEPSKIICLGDIAFEEVETLNTTAKIYHFEHPSRIVRFQMDKEDYKKRIKEAICE